VIDTALASPLVRLLGLLVGLALVVSAVERLTNSRSRQFRPGRVTGVVGPKGGGKSLLAAWAMDRQLRFKCRYKDGTKGYGHVAANFTVTFPGAEDRVHYITCWEDLFDLPKGTLVVVDEIHVWAPAEAGRTLAPHVLALLSQLRRMGLELIWITQHEANVATGVRRQTDTMMLVRAGSLYHVAQGYPIEEFRKAQRPGFRVRYRVTRRLAAIYDTMEFIAATEHAAGSEHFRRLRTVRGALDGSTPQGATPSGARSASVSVESA